MYLQNYEEAVQLLLPKLKDYLESMGINTSQNFSCLNPNHEDKNPSCGLTPNGEAWNCFSCLPKGQQVRTDKGLKSIEDILVGDNIFTMTGELLPVIETHKRNYTSDLFMFTIGNIYNDNLSFTEDHLIAVIKDIPSKCPYIRWDKQRNGFKFYQQDKKRKRIKKYKNTLSINFIEAQFIEEGDYVILPVLEPTRTDTFIDNIWALPYSSGPRTKRIESIPINTDTMWLFGMYCAEGSLYRGGIKFSLHRKETFFANRIRDIINKYFGKEAKFYKYDYKPNSIDIACSSTDLEHAFKGMFGSLCFNKKVPTFFVQLSKKLQRSFLEGLLDGDGTNLHQSITLTSRELISVAQQILVNLEIPFSFSYKLPYSGKDGIERRETYFLYIKEFESLNGFFEEIDGRKYFLQRICKITKKNYDDLVYDITIDSKSEDNSTFLCQHYAVHNCSSSGTIFNACSILEKKPSTGPEFVHETLTYLAEKYDIPLKKEEPTEEELYRIDTYKAYRIAGELVVNGTPTEIFESTLKTRGWSRDTCQQLGVGFIRDFKEFKDNLRLAGFSQKFLSEVDLNRETIFGDDRLIFIIKDEHGSPVGFASRDLNFKKEEEGSKYVNQKSTGVKCNIYQKSKRLFGLDRFLKKRGKKPHPLYIFEGYSDVVTAAEHGLWNSVAIGGTALTIEHIHLLKEKNVYNIRLCLDGDNAGQEATARLLDTILAGHKDLDVKIIIIPGGMDPDEYIRKESIHKFRRLKRHSAFEWRLSRFDEDTDTETICNKMIPLIVNETSFIRQESMAQELAEATGRTLKNIQRELDRIQNQRDAEKQRDIREVGEKLASNLSKDPYEIHRYLIEADTALYDLARRYDEDSFSKESVIARVIAQKEMEESMDGSFSGFILGPNFHKLEEALCGQWKKDVWMCWTGKPNSGKTSVMSALAYEIARHEKENDACVIYHTIDDTFEQLLPKFVALAKGSTDLEINMITNPKYAIRDTAKENSIEEDRLEGYNILLDLMKRGRLLIKDSNDGASLSFADNLIRKAKDTYPERNIVYILDNFHKLSDFKHIKDERVRFKELSKAQKGLATKHHICAMSTVELRKIPRGVRPSNEDIKESIQIEYDTNFIAHVFNEAHELGGAAVTVHRDKNNNRQPIIEIDIAKNKISSFKDRLYYKFYPASSIFTQTSASTVESLRREEKDKVKGDNSMDEKYFVEACKIAKEAGSENPGRPYWILFDIMNLNKEIEEDKNKVSEIWTQFGGKQGVSRIWNEAQ